MFRRAGPKSEIRNSMFFIDLTHTLLHGMPVFPGEQPPSLLADVLPEDAGYMTYRLESNMHTGTHMDAPYHALADELTIDSYPPELFTGSAAVIDVRGAQTIRMKPEWMSLFRQHPVILFCTGHSRNWMNDNYYQDYPVFDDLVAESLVEAGVRIAGFDSPSPDKAPFRFHSIYLRDTRFLVENLANLEPLLGQKEIEFMAFPLKIKAEASLIRAVARVVKR